MERRRAGVSFLLAVASVSVWLAAPAEAAPAGQVTCGQVITQSVKLANDLVDCPRHGLVVGAPNITIDLNGHTVDGNGTLFDPCPADEPCNAGIANSGVRNGRPFNGHGFPGVTIKNGAVTQFAEGGVYIVGTSDNIVRGLRTATSAFESDGVHLRDCTRCRIEDTSATAFSFGIVVERSNDVRVSNSDVHHNQFGGIGVFLSQAVTVAGNRVHDHADADAIVVAAGSQGNTVRSNTVFANGGGIGMSDASDHNVVVDNAVRDNTFVGIYSVGSTGNQILRNRVSGNGDGSEGGIHVVADPGNADTVVSGNTVNANHGDGILVDDGNTGTVLERNQANRNTDDGMDVDSASATLRGNDARNNGDLGIEAVAGVTDGGRNRAGGNGNPAQCVNIACSN